MILFRGYLIYLQLLSENCILHFTIEINTNLNDMEVGNTNIII